jgi:hypothetical protein
MYIVHQHLILFYKYEVLYLKVIIYQLQKVNRGFGS